MSHPSVIELSPTEADDQEEVLEARPAEDAPQETQARHKRKRKAQSKKQLEGEEVLLTHYWSLCGTC